MITVNVLDVGLRDKKKDLLIGLTAEMRGGERIAIAGPNGAGKSAFIKILAGFWRATSGSVRISVGHCKDIAAPRIGYVPQSLDLWDHLTVEEHLRLLEAPTPIFGGNELTECSARLRSVLDEFNLTELAPVPAGRLSGGQRQRLALARAVYSQPHLLLLDEFTSSLDPETARKTLKSLRTNLISTDNIIIFASHNLAFIQEFGTRLLFLEEAKLVCDVPLTSTDSQRLPTRVRKFFFGSSRG